MTDTLAGTTVLVTRPADQAEYLANLIGEHGGEVLRFAAIEIEPRADIDTARAQIGALDRYDIVIFISTNAVTHALPLLPAEGPLPRLAAIGPATARALEEAGYRADIRASGGFTSEALLDAPELADVSGRQILIFRGVGGRGLLGRKLSERGAEVTYGEVYRRRRPDALDAQIGARLADGSIDIVTATSEETLVNLLELAAPSAQNGLKATQLVTASARVVKKAAALGFERPALLAAGPDDDALVAAILQWRSEAPVDSPGESPDELPGESPVEPPPDHTFTNQGTSEHNVDNTDESPAEQPGRAETPSARATAASATVAPPPVTAAAAPAPPPPPRRRGGVLAALALLVALGAAAGTAYLWWLGQNTTPAESPLVAELAAARAGLGGLETELAGARREIAALSGRLEQNQQRLSKATAAHGGFDERIDDVKRSIETLSTRLQGTEGSLDDLRGVSASARDNWVRAEAEYFMQTANSRLQLARDPDVALAALRAADDRLKSLGDPALFRIRGELATEIAALKAMPRPDLESIALTLNGLATQIESLPLLESSPTTFRKPGGGTVEGETATARAMSTLKGVFRDMVSVKRTDAQITPLMAPSEAYFLRRNLELQLQTARLSALRGDVGSYRDSLRTAREWLETHFKIDDAAVRSALETLAGLAREDIAPALPDISGSLRMLRLASSNRSGASTNTDTGSGE